VANVGQVAATMRIGRKGFIGSRVDIGSQRGFNLELLAGRVSGKGDGRGYVG